MDDMYIASIAATVAGLAGVVASKWLPQKGGTEDAMIGRLMTRLEDVEELENIGFTEFLGGDGVAVVFEMAAQNLLGGVGFRRNTAFDNRDLSEECGLKGGEALSDKALRSVSHIHKVVSAPDRHGKLPGQEHGQHVRYAAFPAVPRADDAGGKNCACVQPPPCGVKDQRRRKGFAFFVGARYEI